MSGVKGQVQQRGVARRAAIVDAALALFAQGGSRATSLAELAAHAGVTAPAVLHHFGSKERLLLAVLAEADRRVTPMIDEVMEPGGLAALRGLRRFADMMEQHRELPALHLLLEAEHLNADDPVGRYMVARARVGRQRIAEAIAAGQAAGEIDPSIDAIAKAAEIVAFIDGAVRAWLVDPALSLVALYDSYFDALEPMLRPTRGRRAGTRRSAAGSTPGSARPSGRR